MSGLAASLKPLSWNAVPVRFDGVYVFTAHTENSFFTAIVSTALIFNLTARRERITFRAEVG
jgi:hypothetical protein